MSPNRAQDAGIAASVTIALFAIVTAKGDALYAGLWYYVAVPLAILGLCAAFKPPPAFITGASIALTTIFLAYLSINWSASRPKGLLVLGHMFSLPGALIGGLLAARLANKKAKMAPPVGVALVGFTGIAA